MISIVGVSGSLRKGSYNRALLRAAGSGMSLSRPRRLMFAAIVAFAFVSGCTRVPTVAVTPIKAKNLNELQTHLAERTSTDVDVFRPRGPFAVTVHDDRELRISGNQRIAMDVYLSAPPEKAPLVVFLHGYDSSKGAHAYQAMHLASWGLHCITVQLPAHGPWISNGRMLATIVRAIQRAPQVIDPRVDPGRIVLVGHSFGASAVAVALADGAPAMGAILLDPAAIGRDLPQYLRRVSKPVMVLGADDDLSSARNRDYFYEYIRTGIAEVSIRDATHEDAQFPSEFSLHNFGFDPDTTEDAQLAFVSALTAAAMSLVTTGAFERAWTTFRPALADGKFFNPRKK